MCATCTKARKMSATDGLKLIEKELKAGKDYDHFEKVTNELLGTEMPKTDKKLDAAWEKAQNINRAARRQ